MIEYRFATDLARRPAGLARDIVNVAIRGEGAGCAFVAGCRLVRLKAAGLIVGAATFATACFTAMSRLAAVTLLETVRTTCFPGGSAAVLVCRSVAVVVDTVAAIRPVATDFTGTRCRAGSNLSVDPTRSAPVAAGRVATDAVRADASLALSVL